MQNVQNDLIKRIRVLEAALKESSAGKASTLLDTEYKLPTATVNDKVAEISGAAAVDGKSRMSASIGDGKKSAGRRSSNKSKSRTMPAKAFQKARKVPHNF